MIAALAMWAAIAGTDPEMVTDRAECVWAALSPARRETLVAAGHGETLDSRVKEVMDRLPADEVEAATAKCGQAGPEAWSMAEASIVALAQRHAAEAALGPHYTPERLAVAFAPLRKGIEAAGKDLDEAGLASFEARFLESLGGPTEPTLRGAVHRYLEAATYVVLIEQIWLEMDAWVAKGRPMDEPGMRD